MSVKSTSFSEMGSVCPAQIIHPAGAKLPAKILISPMYGMLVSVLAREDADQRDAPIEHQVRLTVLVRLAAADTVDCRGLQRGQVGRTAVAVRKLGQRPRIGGVPVRRGGVDEVIVRRQRLEVDRHGLRA